MTGAAILLPLDGSQAALRALPVARVFSALEDVPLRILHVSDRAPAPAELAERLGVSPTELRGVSVDLRSGEASAAIVQAVREGARVVVLCTYTAGGPPADVLGATALAVLREAACPVVLVNPRLDLEAWALRKILIPHEGTPAMSDAVRPAAELARRAGAELVVLQVAVAGAAAPAEAGSITPPAYLDQAQYEWPAWASEFIERLACVCPIAGLRVRMVLGRGPAADEILRVSREQAASLIVLAWKGRWAPSHAETLRQVVRDAPCPTLVLRL